MIPRTFQFLIKYRAPLVGLGTGLITLGVPALTLDLAADFDEIRSIDMLNLITAPIIGYGAGCGATHGVGKIRSSWNEFTISRQNFRYGGAWPSQLQSTFHRIATINGAKIGSLGGIGAYLFGFILLAIGCGFSGDGKKTTNLLRSYSTLAPIVCFLAGATAGGIGGAVLSRAATSRMLWN